MRRIKRIFFIGLLVLTAFFLSTNMWVVLSTENAVFDEVADLPSYSVALVLGTSHRSIDGGANPFFEKRIETAAKLYELHKIRHFILSGDNRTKYYNEPVEMRKALMQKGVPADAITLDFAGLRTLDSIVRSKEIFGQDSLVVITQSFHSNRALFICNYYGINAVAMVAEDPELERTFKVRLREYLARPKAVLDLFVLKTAPRHLGKKEEINA